VCWQCNLPRSTRYCTSVPVWLTTIRCQHADKRTSPVVDFCDLDIRPSCLVTVRDRSFATSAPRLWNSLPSDVQSASSLTNFRRKHWKYIDFSNHYLTVIDVCHTCLPQWFLEFFLLLALQIVFYVLQCNVVLLQWSCFSTTLPFLNQHIIY